jgi:hypothetical protein
VEIEKWKGIQAMQRTRPSKSEAVTKQCAEALGPGRLPLGWSVVCGMACGRRDEVGRMGWAACQKRSDIERRGAGQAGSGLCLCPNIPHRRYNADSDGGWREHGQETEHCLTGMGSGLRRGGGGRGEGGALRSA